MRPAPAIPSLMVRLLLHRPTHTRYMASASACIACQVNSGTVVWVIMWRPAALRTSRPLTRAHRVSRRLRWSTPRLLISAWCSGTRTLAKLVPTIRRNRRRSAVTLLISRHTSRTWISWSKRPSLPSVVIAITATHIAVCRQAVLPLWVFHSGVWSLKAPGCTLGRGSPSTLVSPMTPVSPHSENRKGAFLLVDIWKRNRPVKKFAPESLVLKKSKVVLHILSMRLNGCLSFVNVRVYMCLDTLFLVNTKGLYSKITHTVHWACLKICPMF